MSTQQTKVIKDAAAKQIRINRVFDAPVETVWRAYTDASILDQWWGPHPWRAVTKSMDFKVGGYWLYAMVGPNGETHWAKLDYTAIDKPRRFDALASFCDENGVTNPAFSSTKWTVSFTDTGNGTSVDLVMTYATEAAMQQILEMGFEEGMLAIIEQLAELLINNRI